MAAPEMSSTYHMQRHWSINGRFLTQPVSGVQRYAREVVISIDQLMREGHPLTDKINVELVVPPGAFNPPRLQMIRLRETSRLGGHVWEQVVLPLIARHGLISLGNTGPIAAAKHIVCIHDVNTRLFPSSYTLPFRMLYRALQPALGRTALAITTVSQFSARELARYRIAGSQKISIIPNGHEHVLRWHAEHTSATRAVAGTNTIAVIGSAAPHKNLELVIKLAPRLAAAGFRVAITGLREGFALKSGIIRDLPQNVVCLGRLPDNALAALLQDCLCLAFPSFTEGFGLPALEAMALGCPVVASNCASLPDICGDAALYAPPHMPDLWFQNFVQLRQDKSLRATLSAQGRARAERYSWRTSALHYLALMARADGLAVNVDADRLSGF